MSGYRSYVPWNKTSGSSTPGAATSSLTGSSKKVTPTLSKYETSYSTATPASSTATSRSRSDAKKAEDKSSTSSGLATGKYSSYSSGYQRDTSASRDSGNVPSKLNEISARYNKNPEKKDTSHPPVTYRTLARTGARSRDPSPIERDKTDQSISSTSSSYNYNKLYPKSYTTTRSISRDRTEPSSSTTIPKYTGRSSMSKDEPKYGTGITRERTESTSSTTTIPNYCGRSSITKDDTLKYPLGISRESSTSSTIPKYTGRTSISEDDRRKYSGRLSTSKDDVNKYSTKIRDDRSNYTGRTSTTKDETPKYSGRSSISNDDSKYSSKSTSSSSKEYQLARSSRNASREDLSNKYKTPSSTHRDDKGPKSYISSRFLPKNSVEKSYTAYSRPSTTKTSEISRKNRELLNVLSAQQDDRSSRPSSRCSSVASEDIAKDFHKQEHPAKISEVEETETLTVVTRSTSPNPPSQTNIQRTRRLEVARQIEKQITRSKVKRPMVDKEIQSDRMDDSTKSSRFAGSSRITATPWSSYLDVKYSSPGESTKNSKELSQSNELPTLETNVKPNETNKVSPKLLSRDNSLKSNNVNSSKSELNSKFDQSTGAVNSKSEQLKSQATSKLEMNSKLKSPNNEKPKSKISPPKTGQIADKNQLPPIPKSDSPSKSGSLHSLNTLNKDFRKSILNMNPDEYKKKNSKRSNSVSSADDDGSEATEISENLSSYPKSSSTSSKLPQSTDVSVSRTRRSNTRSPSVTSDSSSSSAATSGSEDDCKRKSKSKSSSDTKLKKLQSAASSRTSVLASSADELSLDKSLKPPLSPRVKVENEKTAEAKSFLMRALAPVTNLFKGRHQDSSEKANWGDSSSENISDIKTDSASKTNSEIKRQSPKNLDKKSPSPKRADEQRRTKVIISRVESGDRGWWLSEEQGVIENSVIESNERLNLEKSERGKSELGNSGSGKSASGQIGSGRSGRSGSDKPVIKILHRVESGEKAWWLSPDSEVPEGVTVYPVPVEESISADGKIYYKIRAGDSKWLDNWQSENSSESSDLLKKYKIRHVDSGERPWWLSSSENIPEGVIKWEIQKESSKSSDKDESSKGSKYNIKPMKAGSKAWWLGDDEEDIPKQAATSNETDEESDGEIPLGDRASPEGLEMPREEESLGRLSPYDNVPSIHSKPKRSNHLPLFISKHTNIDDILGGSSQMLSPLMDRIFSFQDATVASLYNEKCEEVDAGQVRIHDSTTQRGIIQPGRLDVIGGIANTYARHDQLDDAALQLYKDGDYGSYLDLEASISEQQEEFEGFQLNKKNSIVLRTQLSVRVHTIIEKLYNSEGRELRRALFSLKQIFQEDKDLVHEFVQNDGLSCLIKVGSEADQNYQNYILRALGQVMLYVDGMNGVMEHNKTVQWLYNLISSKFRLVVKTALKLLLVFVEYTDSNCMLLIKAIHTVDCSQGLLPWFNIMRLLKDFDSADTELLIYATTLINKCLNGVPDQDTYYDQTDALEEQSIESIIQRYMSKPGTDLDLLQQFQIYEAVLQYEDGEEKGTPLRHLDESIRKTLRNRKSVVDSSERRKSRRHSTGNTPVHSALNNNIISNNSYRNTSLQANTEDDDESSSSAHSDINSNINGSYKENNKAHEAGVTPALRRRRERAERQRSFMREQQENAALLCSSTPTNNDGNLENENGTYTNGLQQRLANGNSNRTSSRKDLTPLLNAVNKLDSEENSLTKQPWILSMMYNKSIEDQNNQENIEDAENSIENDRNLLLQLKRENTVKDLTQKLANQNIISSPSSEENKVNRIGDMSGLISKAKEGLAKSKSQANVVKSPTGENISKIVEIKKSENELRWEELVANMNRPLNLCDMDFTDLASDDEGDILAPIAVSNGIPPPPPPLLRDNYVAPPPPPLANVKGPPPVPNPPMFGMHMQKLTKPAETKIPIKKNKKTVKLFWKEVRDDPVSAMKQKAGYIWDELSPVSVDTQKLEHLFESRAKDLITKKQQEMNKNKEIIVLDPKRSNAINIGMTKLPPPRSIKTAILKMDATIMNREGIEKLLTMLPTEEERTKIQEAQAANPDLPLGSAEQFLLTLASISELPARLKLWAFKLDFENTEREIAEPLMDLKQGIEVLRVNKTFRGILSTLLSIGNFLNGNEVKGFQIEYLSKVPEVKDTVHKHSLLHHLCHIVMEKFPDATDLYSEIGAITRASKVDFDELTLNIQRLEADCKSSWDHLKLIAKHDGSTMMKVKMSDFLADCAERIILVGIIHRRVMNRYHKFLLWLGLPVHQVGETKPNEFCRIVSEFALEYRTTRERVLQQLEKKANHRERNKTRGKMITESGKFKTKEDRADAELRQLLGSDISDVESMQGTLPWRRTRRESNRSFMGQLNGNLTDGDDEILESLVKTATKATSSRTAPRERKRTRHADRKSLRRTLKNGLSEEEKKHLSAYIKGY